MVPKISAQIIRKGSLFKIKEFSAISVLLFLRHFCTKGKGLPVCLAQKSEPKFSNAIRAGEQNKNSSNAGTIHLFYGLLNLYTNCLVFLKEMFPLKSRSQPSYPCRSVTKNVFLKWIRKFFQKVTGKEVLKMGPREWLLFRCSLLPSLWWECCVC